MAKEKNPVRTDLSRSDMEKIIKGGGSVMVNGEIVTKVEYLPDTDESIGAAEEELAERKRKARGVKTTAEIKAMKVEELDAYAEQQGIDLTGAKLKEDKLAAILEAQEG